MTAPQTVDGWTVDVDPWAKVFFFESYAAVREFTRTLRYDHGLTVGQFRTVAATRNPDGSLTANDGSSMGGGA